MKYFLLTYIFIFSISCFGQQLKSEKDSISFGKLLKYDAKQTFKSIGYSITRPLKWKKKDFITLGAMVGGTYILSAADGELRNFAQRNKDDFPELIRDIGWYYGSPQNYFMVNAGLYGVGLFTKNEKIRKTSVLIISSSVTAGLVTSLLKNSIGRARPSAELGNHYYKPFSKDGKFHSFPSGHSSLSITMAHAISKQFDNTWIKVGIYTIGAIPPISRMIDDAHWITDVAFSTALSIIVVDSIDNYLFESNAYKYSKKEKQISWNLKFSGSQIGIVGTF